VIWIVHMTLNTVEARIDPQFMTSELMENIMHCVEIKNPETVHYVEATFKVTYA